MHRLFVKEDRGFTFIEVMMAVLLLGLALVPMLSLFSASGRISAGSWAECTAVNLAQSKLEEIKDADFDSVATASGAFPENSDYSFVAEVTPDPAGPSNLKIVAVTVNYLEADAQKSITITMEKARR